MTEKEKTVHDAVGEALDTVYDVRCELSELGVKSQSKIVTELIHIGNCLQFAIARLHAE